MVNTQAKTKCIFTGGGTTGHVTKNLIVMEALKKQRSEMEFHYIGSKMGKEGELIVSDAINRVPTAVFHPISTGKLRRYFSLETIPDFFKFLAGIWQSFFLLHHLQPKLIFSSGGYVALPVCIAAWLRGIPIVTHETDSYPGMANRLIGRMAKKVLLGYESAAEYFNPNKVVVTGNPVSPKLLEGSRERGLKKLGFDPNKKTILFMGGSQGAEEINGLVAEILPQLLKEWQVVHLTGGGGKPATSNQQPAYRPFSYVTTDYADFLASADLVVSRAGGNSIAEIEALGKKAILIPLPLPAAAGDHQRKNAVEVARRAVRSAGACEAGSEAQDSEAEISEKISAKESEVPIEEMLKKMPRWRMLEKPSAKELLEAIQDLSATLANPLAGPPPAKGGQVAGGGRTPNLHPLARGLGGLATEKIVNIITVLLSS